MRLVFETYPMVRKIFSSSDKKGNTLYCVSSSQPLHGANDRCLAHNKREVKRMGRQRVTSLSVVKTTEVASILEVFTPDFRSSC